MLQADNAAYVDLLAWEPFVCWRRQHCSFQKCLDYLVVEVVVPCQLPPNVWLSHSQMIADCLTRQTLHLQVVIMAEVSSQTLVTHGPWSNHLDSRLPLGDKDTAKLILYESHVKKLAASQVHARASESISLGRGFTESVRLCSTAGVVGLADLTLGKYLLPVWSILSKISSMRPVSLLWSDLVLSLFPIDGRRNLVRWWVRRTPDLPLTPARVRLEQKPTGVSRSKLAMRWPSQGLVENRHPQIQNQISWANAREPALPPEIWITLELQPICRANAWPLNSWFGTICKSGATAAPDQLWTCA